MTESRYQAGDGFAIVTSGAVALLDLGTQAIAEEPEGRLALNRLWRLAAGAPTARTLLEQIRAGNLYALGAGCIVVGLDSAKAVVSGNVTAHIREADGTLIDLRCGPGVDVLERLLPAGSSIELVTASGQSGEFRRAGGDGLVIVSGIALAGRIRLALPGPMRRSFDGPESERTTARVKPEPKHASPPPEPPYRVPDTVTPAGLVAPMTPANPVAPATPAFPSEHAATEHAATERAAAEPVPPPPPQFPGVRGAAAGLQLEAVLCMHGHPNPASVGHCRECGLPMPQVAELTTVRLPSLGTLRFTTGQRVPLSQNLIVGRNPSLTRASPSDLPGVVRITGSAHVSRTHTEIKLDGWRVLVIDLGSSNGTVVQPPHSVELFLDSGVPYEIHPGWVVELTEGVSFRYEVP